MNSNALRSRAIVLSGALAAWTLHSGCSQDSDRTVNDTDERSAVRSQPASASVNEPVQTSAPALEFNRQKFDAALRQPLSALVNDPASRDDLLNLAWITVEAIVSGNGATYVDAIVERGAVWSDRAASLNQYIENSTVFAGDPDRIPMVVPRFDLDEAKLVASANVRDRFIWMWSQAKERNLKILSFDWTTLRCGNGVRQMREDARFKHGAEFCMTVFDLPDGRHSGAASFLAEERMDVVWVDFIAETEPDIRTPIRVIFQRDELGGRWFPYMMVVGSRNDDRTVHLPMM